MREINECTEEVFRRSEKRITERRRKRGRVLAVCIPICLIAAAWSAVVFSPMWPEGGGFGQESLSGGAAGNAPGSACPASPYDAVEIQSGGIIPKHYEEVTDRTAVAEIFCAIDVLFADAGGGDGNISENFQVNEEPSAVEDTGNHDLIESEDKSKDCTVTFTAEDGSRAVYRLSGNTLLNGSTDETVFLSDAQTAGLLAVLGLAE